MNHVYRGPVEECVRHFAARFQEVYPKGSRLSTEGKRPIAEFCGVNIHTVTDWFFRLDNLPVGERQIKLLCFLDLNGYKVTELERMSLKCRNFAKLIGYGLVKSEDAVEWLGYTQPSELFRALRGVTGLNHDREEKLWDLWKARRDKLDAAIEEAAKRFRFDFSSIKKIPTSTNPDSVSGHSPVGCSRDGVISIMKGLLELLNSGTLANLSDDEWVALRSSSETILQLSSHLSTLSAKLVKSS